MAHEQLAVHIHLSETLEEEKIIEETYNKRGTEYLNDLGVFDVPVVLAHGIYISDSDIEILKNAIKYLEKWVATIRNIPRNGNAENKANAAKLNKRVNVEIIE